MPPKPATRTILHADMDAFYAAIEQRDRPELRGRPVIVGGDGPRGVVATASYEARRFGVHSAMPAARARALCPGGVFLPVRMAVYAAESRRVFEVFERYTPEVEGLSLDEAFLDVTGSRTLFGDGRRIAERIQADVREATALGVSIGVAASKYVAKVASDLEKPAGLVVVEPGTEQAFLAPLPVKHLWGAGPVVQERLERLGLRTILDVQRCPVHDLAAALGDAAARHFRALAHGVDPRPVVPDRRARSIGHERTFDVDLGDDDACLDVLMELCEAVCRRLRRARLRGRVVALKLRFPPFSTVTRRRTLATASDDDLTVFGCVRRMFLDARASGTPVRLLGVSMSDLRDAALPEQGSLFDRNAGPASRRLLEAMDAIRDRFGEDAIRHGRRRADEDPRR